jgi:hypothetical protein
VLLYNTPGNLAKAVVELPDSLGRENIVKVKSEMPMILRRCLGVKEKMVKNTLLEYDLKSEASMEILNKKNTQKEVHLPKDGLGYWTDGSRLVNKRVGCTVVWKEGNNWRNKESHLRTKKEVYNAK